MIASKVQRSPRWLSFTSDSLGASKGMAPRLASPSNSSSVTKRNLASGSTNFLISHGQATRSTLMFLRVTHSMSHLLSVVSVYEHASQQAITAVAGMQLLSHAAQHHDAQRKYQKRNQFAEVVLRNSRKNSPAGQRSDSDAHDHDGDRSGEAADRFRTGKEVDGHARA